MAFGDWFWNFFGRRKKATLSLLVPFLDIPTGRVIRIPRAELGPDTVLVHLDGMSEPVWVESEQLRNTEPLHPPFDEEVRNCIRIIQAAFAEHRPLAFDEWEDVFRREAFPLREIRLWLHAADIYSRCSNEEPSAARRRDMYRCIIACINSTREEIRQTFRPAILNPSETEQLIQRFFDTLPT